MFMIKGKDSSTLAKVLTISEPKITTDQHHHSYKIAKYLIFVKIYYIFAEIEKSSAEESA